MTGFFLTFAKSSITSWENLEVPKNVDSLCAYQAIDSDKPPIELVAGPLSRVAIPNETKITIDTCLALYKGSQQAYLWLSGEMGFPKRLENNLIAVQATKLRN